MLHRICRAAWHRRDDMIRRNNCIPGPVYPLTTERTVSQSCIGAGQEGWKCSEGLYQFGCSWHRSQSRVLLLTGKCGSEQLGLIQIVIVSLFPFSGGTKNDVVDGPCVQIHKLWPSVPHPWGLLHQTGKRPVMAPNILVLCVPVRVFLGKAVLSEEKDL